MCDLDGIDFLAVSAADILVDVADRAHALHVEFVLVASCRPVRRVVELPGPDRDFVVTPSRVVAVTGAGAGDRRASLTSPLVPSGRRVVV